jgi:hypothetical protein
VHYGTGRDKPINIFDSQIDPGTIASHLTGCAAYSTVVPPFALCTFFCDADELSVAIIVFVAFLESGASILSQMPSILLLKSWRRVKKVRKQHLCSNRPLNNSAHDFTDYF